MPQPPTELDVMRRYCADALRLDALERPRFFQQLAEHDAELARQVERRVAHRLKLEQHERFEFLTASEPFILADEIGRGVTGTVYRAEHRLLKKSVALKVLHSSPGAERFLAEARAAARLDHPAIAPVFDCGLWNGRPYLAMELVDGPPLAEVLASLSGNYSAIATLFEQIAAGIGAAHKQGVIHRDLKPTNIMLAREGVPKIIDFGCAKSIESQLQLTAAGELIGTPRYMSPEQAAGDSGRLGPTTDVFSLGVMLYEALTGEHPCSGPPETFFQQLKHAAPPRPRSADAGIPPDLEAICLKCLEKQCEQRYPDGAELAADLQRFLNAAPVKARPYYRLRYVARKSTHVAAAIAIVLLLAALVAAPFAYAGAPTLRYWWRTAYDRWLRTTDAIAGGLADDTPRAELERATASYHAAQDRQIARENELLEHYRQRHAEQIKRVESGDIDDGLPGLGFFQPSASHTPSTDDATNRNERSTPPDRAAGRSSLDQ